MTAHKFLSISAGFLVLAVTSAFGQGAVRATKVSAIASPAIVAPVSDSVIANIDESKLSLIEGNVRPEAQVAANDLGPADASLPLEHVMLLLHPTPEKEAAFTAYVESLHDKSSPNFHKWLTAEQIGTKYGPSKKDLQKISDWLTLKGMTVEYVYPNGTNIAFSGSVAQVESAFHTSIHKVMVDGKQHIANVKDISIPTALTSVVTGIVTLHDIMPKTMHKQLTTSHFDVRNGTMTDAMPHKEATGVHPNDTFTYSGATYEAVGPADLSTIYRLFKLFKAGITGAGQTIYVIEDSNLYADSDVTTFQSVFGLTQYGGTHTTVHPTGGTTCTNPGVVNGTDGEVSLDVEYALAAAPAATVVVASCKDTTTFGGLIALNNLIASATPPAIVSISYGESEEYNGATANAAYNTAYKNAVAVGTSVFVSSGDEGAASSDANLTKATHGINVSGFASTPYNVAVGGTDFRDTYDGTNATYWDTNAADSTAANYYSSALSYIPETPWADSCANYLIYKKAGYTSPYSTTSPAYTGYCNTLASGSPYLSTGGGSGGPSGCATGTASKSGVQSGTCAGYAKPSWQALVGVPADGVRGLPDVSLFAANGAWGHYYPYCYTNPGTNLGGYPCTGSPDNWSGAGGTSFASPILAAMQALINQKTGTIWGNPNPVYYAIAADASQYGTSGNSLCDSSLGPQGGQCVFHDVTFGDMAVNCNGASNYNCYRPTGTYGILSTSTTAPVPAYSAGIGWDFATGIGTVNAQSLITAFNAYYVSDGAPVGPKASAAVAPVAVRSLSTK